MSGEKVSVILPVYNRLHSLGDAIGSVLSQSYQNLELIVVDDASTVDLTAVIDAIDDPRISFIRRPQNGGASAARNTGLEAATGDFIAFQDSDDIWLPGKLARQVEALCNSSDDVGVITGPKIGYVDALHKRVAKSYVVLAPDPGTAPTNREDQAALYLTTNRISLQNALFRRNCFPMPWFDPRVRANADWAFTVRLAQATMIKELPEPVVLGFESPDSVSTNSRNKAIGLIRILKQNREIYASHPVQYAENLWTLGRYLTQNRKPGFGRRFCLEALRRRPQILLSVVRRRLGFSGA